MFPQLLFMAYWPSQFSGIHSITSNATLTQSQYKPQKQDPKAVKEAYNCHVQELKQKFEEDVNAIVNEFSA